MELEDFKNILETTGFPVVYWSFPEGEAPPLPFICYIDAGSNNFIADGKVYHKSRRINVELYTRHKDPEAESKVETALENFKWKRTENYIESEQCFEISYELEV